ncbi:MAG: hypothetical protein ACI9OJ_003008 [Myxococcota bacterium]|jgi:hypothetical protein
MNRRTFSQQILAGFAGASLLKFGGCCPNSQIHGDRFEELFEPAGDKVVYIETYGGQGVQSATKALKRPATLDDFKSQSRGRSVNIRGGGYSFDAQSLPGVGGGDLLYTHKLELGAIEIVGDTVSAPANASWGDVVEKCLEQGTIPQILVTGSGTTVGGTASSNGLSRHTPLWGKESRVIESIDVVTWDGKAMTGVTPSLHPDLFFAAIGGFGACGLITRVTHRLQRIGETPRMRTQIRKFHKSNALTEFCDNLKPDCVDEHPTRTRYGLMFPRKNGEFRGMTMDTEYDTGSRRLAYSAYLEWPCYGDKEAKSGYYSMAADPKRVQRLRELAWNTASSHVTYLDEVMPYTFFQDGHVMGKRDRALETPKTITLQQTWIIPESAPGTSQTHLIGFLNAVLGYGFVPRELGPTTFVDTFYVPADDSLLSASYGMPGFAVTVAFEGPKDTEANAINALSDLTDECAAVGGRVHLTKHVYGDTAVIRKMYTGQLVLFNAARKKYDSEGRWRNPLFERVFGTT